MEADLLKEKTELMIKMREIENSSKQRELTFKEGLEK